MSSIAFKVAMAAYDAVDAALGEADAIDADPLTHAERLVLLERRETWRRRLPAGEHDLLNELVYAASEDIGGRPAHVLADRLRIYRRDARARFDEAVDLGSRTTLTGQPLPAKLEATAGGSARG